MDDWRSPKAKIKGRVKKSLLQACSLIGRLQRETQGELLTRPCETVPFYGHRIGGGPDLAAQAETRLCFLADRPVYETAHNLDYSETGMAWINGCLIEKFSVQPLRLSDLRDRPQKGSAEVENCAIVQCDFVYSYGDWVHCYLGTLLSASFPDVPVLIPRHLADKKYVQRDLEQAQIDWRVAQGWTRIQHAFILRKPNPNFYWSARDVAAYRRAFAPNPPVPEPRSLSYLGRFDLKGETVARTFPSTEAATYVRSRGGRVISQADLTTQTAAQYAVQAETVIGDHGSGLLNIMFWRPKTVIELVVNEWWVNNTLFAAAGMGVQNFGVIRVDGLTSKGIGERVESCLEFFHQDITVVN